MDIAGRTVVVTGAAAGIGRATALMFAELGAARIHLADVDEAGLRETAAAIGPAATIHRIDLAEVAKIPAWLNGLGDYDVLFNNAGVVAGAPAFPEAPLEKLQWIVDVNLTSLVVATQTAAQAMRGRGGVIVNTVSTVALGKGFRDALYAATKSGVMMFTRCCGGLRDDWNVRVAGVLPGLVDTPILYKTGADGAAPWMEPILANNEKASPRDIAEAVIDLVQDDSLAGGDWVAVRRIGGRVERQWGHEEPA